MVACLDRGASLAPTSPCLVSDTATLSYAETQGLSRSIAASLEACGVAAGDTVGVLSPSDPLAITCAFGASRAGACWALVEPDGATPAELLQELGECTVLFFRVADAGVVAGLHPLLSHPHVLVCLDGRMEGALSWGEFLVVGLDRQLPETGASETGTPEAGGSAAVRASFLAVGPLTEAATSRWQPVLAQGGAIVMRGTEAPVDQRARLEA
jgi:non-ribosomal peptide synthetase component F